MKTTIELLLVVAVLLCGAGSAWSEDLTLDGYDWLDMTAGERSVYVVGALKTSEEPGVPWARGNPFAAPGHTVGDVREAVNAFYSALQNRSILIIVAIKIVTLKFRGVSTPCIDEYTVFERQVTAGASEVMQIPQIERVSKACTGQAYAPKPIPRARYGRAE